MFNTGKQNHVLRNDVICLHRMHVCLALYSFTNQWSNWSVSKDIRRLWPHFMTAFLHPILHATHFDIFASSAMEEDAGHFTGRPFGGMATIVRRSPLYVVQETELVCDRIQRIALRDSSNVLCVGT